MEIKYSNKSYFDGGAKAEPNPEYDYLLFRQDFNRDEITEVLEKIESGEILIHHNYSILFCSNDETLTNAPELWCYATKISTLSDELDV